MPPLLHFLRNRACKICDLSSALPTLGYHPGWGFLLCEVEAGGCAGEDLAIGCDLGKQLPPDSLIDFAIHVCIIFRGQS